MEETLRQRMEADVKTAMKSGDQTARDTIRYTLSSLKNAEIDKRGELTEDEALALLKREVKRRADSIDQFRAAGRADLVDREESQLAILRRYLPAGLSDDELTAIVREIIAETGATGPKDMAKVMPAAIARIGDGADGRRINAAVRQLLATSGG